MLNAAQARERRRARWSIGLTLVCMPCVVWSYWRGPAPVALVASLGFMLGYIFERMRLSGSLVALLGQADPDPPPP